MFVIVLLISIVIDTFPILGTQVYVVRHDEPCFKLGYFIDTKILQDKDLLYLIDISSCLFV